MKIYVRQLTLLDAWTAILTDPRGTMEHFLIEREFPPFVVISLVSVVAVLFAPCLIYQFMYELTPIQPEVTAAFVVTLLVMLVLFTLLLALFMRMIGVSAPINKIIASVVYTLIPIIPVTVTYYVCNVVTIGKPSIIIYLMNGRRLSGDWFLNLFPYFLYGTVFFCFLALMNCFRALGKMAGFAAFLSAAASTGLFAVSFVAATIFTGALYPNTEISTWNYFRNLGNVPDEK
jgi:hypothetical protein